MKRMGLLLSGGVLLAFMIWSFMCRDDEGYKIIRINNSLRFFMSRALEWKRISGKYPETSEDILSGMEQSDVEMAMADKDPWGRPYVYELVEGRPFAFSLGRDGIPGGSGHDSDVIWTIEGEEVVLAWIFADPQS